MKKLSFTFVLSTVGAILSFFSSVLVFSLNYRLPAYTDEEISSTVYSGGFESALLTALMIIFPLLFVTFLTTACICYKKSVNGNGIGAYISKTSEKMSAIHLYIILASIIAVCSLIFLGVHRNTAWDYQISGFGEDAYMDFFNHITYARDPQQTYAQSMHACFPPLAYVMYFLFSLILPTDATVKYFAAETSPYAILTYVMYVSVLTVIFAFIVKKVIGSFGERATLITTVLIILSSVFIYNTERGNSVFIVLILLLAAMHLKDSDKAWKRELALIFIAVAAGIKIYPALFGAIYLAEKRWKEAGRLVIYGVAFFFIPFVFFGGADGMRLFLENQKEVQTEGYASMTSINSFTRLIIEDFTGSPDNYSDLPTLFTLIFVGLSAIAFLSKKLVLWEKVMLLTAVMSFTPAWSGTYTAIFFVLPMLLFFQSCKNGFGTGRTKYYNVACTVLFALSLSLITFVTPEGEPFYQIRYMALHTINLAIIVKSLMSYLHPLLKRKKIEI